MKYGDAINYLEARAGCRLRGAHAARSSRISRSRCASEDVAAVLDGEEPLERFCAVTRAGDFTYLRPYYTERESAERSAVENIDDNIYAEHPVAVIDLDTDERWEPSWDTLAWRNTLAMSVPAKPTELLKLAESVAAGNTDPDVLADAAERVLLGGPCYEREQD